MKQHIEVNQLQELTEEQQQRLRSWWKLSYGDFYHRVINGKIDKTPFICDDFDVHTQDKEHKIPALSIGHMIELLQEKDVEYLGYIFEDYMKKMVEDEVVEFVNELWSAVKEVL